MKRALVGLTLIGLVLSSQGRAQTASPAAPSPSSGSGNLVSPRNPGGVSAGAVDGSQHKMDSTVQQIDHKLLSQEKDRPRLPGQAPSPSQTMPGGVAAGRPAVH